MNQKIPNTPFSTGLSGSAKETEIRLRNLFAGPKKRPPALLVALIALLILLCGNLVAFRPLLAHPTLVMETQYYDTNGNYIEIPALALPAGEKNEAVEAINAALNGLRAEYAQLASWTGGDALENQCLFYPSTTDRYLNLLFFRSRFTTDLNTGHVFSLVYDRKVGTLVSAEDALALAGLNEKGLLDQITEQIQTQIDRDYQEYGFQLALHNLTLEGFRIKADGQPVFYLTGRVDDVDDDVLDAISGADQLYIWEDRAVTTYDQYSPDKSLLVPAEETDRLDPPLWCQWYFAEGEPQGGFADQPASGTSEERLNNMVLDFLRNEYSCAAYLSEDIPEQPQPGDRCLDSAGMLADGFLDEILYSLYEIDTREYTPNQGWQSSSPAYAVLTMSQGVDFTPIAVYNYSEDADPSDIMCQAIWGLMNVEVCLFRDGYSTPLGPANDLSNPAINALIQKQVIWENAEPIYSEGDYWFDATGDGFIAHCYHSDPEGMNRIYQFDTTRTDMYTPRNIRVGDTRADIAAAYPEAYTNGYPWDMFGPLMWYCNNEEGWGSSIIFFFDDNADGSDEDVISRIVLNHVID